MSVNFQTYGEESKGVSSMNSEDLRVGQVIIRIFRPRQHFGAQLGEMKTVEYVIVKILKTRLVVEPLDNPSRSLRIIINQKDKLFGRGDVTNRAEGSNDTWNHDTFDFATEDEEELIVKIEKRYADQKIKSEKVAARKDAFARARRDLGWEPDLETLDGVISSLKSIRDEMAAE